jgi:hypothetical protein
MSVDTLTFYSPLPLFGVPLSRQWDNFRHDFRQLSTLIRAAYADISTTPGDHDLAGWAIGELDFRNRFRIFYAKDLNEFKIQINTGTESVEVWTDALRIRQSDGRVIAAGTGGFQSIGGFYQLVIPQSQTFYGMRFEETLPGGGTVYRNASTLKFDSNNFYLSSAGDGAPIVSLLAGAVGEANSASNIGAGTGLFAAKVGLDLQFKSLVAGSSVSITSTASEVTINATPPNPGFYGITIGQTDNNPVYKNINTVKFNSVDFYVSQNSPNTDEVIVNFRGSVAAGSGEANTASNLGAGEGVFAAKVGVDLQFKSLVAGTNVSLGSDSSTITINSTGGAASPGFYGIIIKESDNSTVLRDDTISFLASDFDVSDVNNKPQVALATNVARLSDVGPGFYGITVGQTDNNPTYKNINTIKFNAAEFYVTQNTPNTDEVVVNFRGSAGGGSGEANTASNLGAGSGVFAAKVGVDLQFKSLVAGTNISLGSDANTVTINSTGSGASDPGFYGIIVEESDQTNTLRDDTIRFLAGDFDVSNVNNKPQVALATNVARTSDIGPGFYGIIVKESDNSTVLRDDTISFLASDFDVSNVNDKPQVALAANVARLTDVGPGFYGLNVGLSTDVPTYRGINTVKFHNLDFYLSSNPSSDVVEVMTRNLVKTDDFGTVRNQLVLPKNSTSLAPALTFYGSTVGIRHIPGTPTTGSLILEAVNTVGTVQGSIELIQQQNPSIEITGHTRFFDQAETTDILRIQSTSSATTPALAFIADSDTGIFRLSSDSGTIRFSSNSAQSAYITRDKLVSHGGFYSLAFGEPIYKITAGDGITIEPSGISQFTISAAQFYGITVAETDGTPSFTRINKLNFETQWFYVEQNSPNTDEVSINFRGLPAGTGEANTASNLGAGTVIFAAKVGVDLQFKSLVAGTNVSLGSDASTITINSTGSGASDPGFYGIIVQESDLTNTLRDDTLRFLASDFDISNVSDKPQIALATNVARLTDVGPGFYGLNVGLSTDVPTYRGINTVKFHNLDFYLSSNPSSDVVEVMTRNLVKTDDFGTVRNQLVLPRGRSLLPAMTFYDALGSGVYWDPVGAVGAASIVLQGSAGNTSIGLRTTGSGGIDITGALSIDGGNINFATGNTLFLNGTTDLRLMGDGSAGSPSIKLGSTADTGIFTAAGVGDNIAFTVDGTLSALMTREKMMVTGGFYSRAFGEPIYKITAGDGITIEPSGISQFTISAAQFYGLTVAETDGTPSFTRVNKLNFESQWFYVEQNAPNTDEVSINFRGLPAGTGEANTASNLGAGEGVFAAKVGVDLQFKSLVAGTNVSLGSDANTITINSTGGAASPGFYGIIVQESDLTNTLRDDTIRFLAGDFDVSNVSDKPQIALATNVARLSDVGPGFYGITVGLSTDNPLYRGINTVKFHTLDFYVSSNLSSDVVEVMTRNLVKTDDFGTVRDQLVLPVGSSTRPSISFYGTPRSGIFARSPANLRDIVIRNDYDGFFTSSLELLSTGRIQVISTGSTSALFDSGGVQLANGAAGAPSVSWLTDNNTGLFRLSTDSGSIRFSSDGTESAFIDRDKLVASGGFYSRAFGEPIYALIAGDGITIEPSGISQFTISAAQFYGITVAETDGTPSFTRINKLNFESQWFYVEQNAPNTDEVSINFRGLSAGSGEANTASNLGAGEGIFSAKVGVDLQFKSLVAGTNITLTPTSTTITINSSGSGASDPGFYGITVGQTNNLPTYKGINTVKFNAAEFYITQNSPNTDEAIVNARFLGDFFKSGVVAMTGQLLLTDGSAAAPAIAFANDTDTGMHRPASNFLEFSAGGTLLLSISPALTTHSSDATLLISNVTVSKNLTVGGGLVVNRVASAEAFYSTDFGEPVYAITAGDGVTVEELAGRQFRVSAAQFYGITVGQTNNLPTYKGINTIKFNVTQFYITQNSPNTDEAIVNIRDLPTVRKVVGGFAASNEWEFVHNLGTSDVTFTVYDAGYKYLIPSKVDTSNPNTAYFYFNTQRQGRAVIIG